jgi:hypothetical protein
MKRGPKPRFNEPLTRPFAVRLLIEQFQWLDEIEAITGMSRADTMRVALSEYYLRILEKEQHANT